MPSAGNASAAPAPVGAAPVTTPGANPSSTAKLAGDLQARIAALQQESAEVVIAARRAHAELLQKLVADTVESVRNGDPLEREAAALLMGKGFAGEGSAAGEGSREGAPS